jgi:SAM-dependent methyltransferase
MEISTPSSAASVQSPSAEFSPPPASPCRFCATPLTTTFVNLGTSPLCQDHVRPQDFNKAEPFYPLHARVCHECFLVQLDEFVSPTEVFNDYAYFSSYSTSWLRHAERYTAMVSERFNLTSDSLAVELASNDGYLLQYFVEKGIPVLGVEPAANVAEYAKAKGINTMVRFFGLETARHIASTVGQADLLLGNNVLAHVPDINDFVSGMHALLKPTGVITMEFPHLLRLIEGNQFDTIYHEHFSYLSFYSVERIFAHHGLTLFDVEELPTHGGSLRIYARHTAHEAQPITERVAVLRDREIEAGVLDLSFYAAFEEKTKESFSAF